MTILGSAALFLLLLCTCVPAANALLSPPHNCSLLLDATNKQQQVRTTGLHRYRSSCLSMHAEHGFVVGFEWARQAAVLILFHSTQPNSHVSLCPADLQAFNISCQKLPTAPADCALMLYYNSTGIFEDGMTNMSELIKPPFGIPAELLPDPVAPWGTTEITATEGPLNRTEPVYNGSCFSSLGALHVTC